jgi:hypothetical protein
MVMFFSSPTVCLEDAKSLEREVRNAFSSLRDRGGFGFSLSFSRCRKDSAFCVQEQLAAHWPNKVTLNPSSVHGFATG